MSFALNGRIPPDDRGISFSVRMICLLATVAATAAGCASPLYRTHSELPLRKNAIRNMGLLPPAITMYEEQIRFKLIPHQEWSAEATNAVRNAFVEEMTAAGFPVVAVDGDDRELNEMADLFGAVDFSIARHVYEDGLNESFPRKVKSFDYSLGPAGETMERHRVDAVWFVTGINLLPTVGTRIADTAEFLLAVAAGGRGGGPMSLMKLELRAALVDKSGTVLFYCKLRQPDVWRAARNLDRFDPSKGGADPGPAADEESLRDDIRDPRIARRYARALASEYRKATAQ